jgi:hypothetical protein
VCCEAYKAMNVEKCFIGWLADFFTNKGANNSDTLPKKDGLLDLNNRAVTIILDAAYL